MEADTIHIMFKVIILLVIVVVFSGGLFFVEKYVFSRITDAPQQVFEQQDINPPQNLENSPAITTYVSDRRIIWAMDFLPDGRMVFTEREGAVNVIEPNGQVTEILNVDVLATGESGLHGIAVDPDFEENGFVYVYYTYMGNGSNTQNRVSRFVFENETLNDEQIIVDDIPGASTHDGGRLKFGQDSFLYITTGDAQEPSSSQDRDSLAGKILRVTGDGEPAEGNPFGTRIYSFGHRNPQGLTWDLEGRLWSTEHGPSTLDELNLIESGANYGWPEITGSATATDMRSPIIQSEDGTWAPAGTAFYADSIFFAGLRGSALYEYNITSKELTTHLKDSLGRIRDVVVGPDGFLYVATSNRDGRGVPAGVDDRILRINPFKLGEI